MPTLRAPSVPSAALLCLMGLAVLGSLLGPHAGGHTPLQGAAVVTCAAFMLWMQRALPVLARSGALRAAATGTLVTLGLYATSPTSEARPLLLMALPFLAAVQRMAWPVRVGLSLALALAPWAALSLSMPELPPLVLAAGLSIGIGLAFQRAFRGEAENRELRNITARTVRHREEERARLARELHDGTGQLVHGLRLELELARHTSGPTARPEVQATLERMERLLTQLNESLREVLLDLRPAILDDAGLALALSELVRDRAAALPHLELTATIDESLDVEDKVIAIAVYRIAQEALTNALRHADATRIALSLQGSPDTLELTVEDDGRGLDASAGAGYGLSHMRERSALIGAELQLMDNAPGTRLVLRCPRRFEASHISSASMPVRR